MRLPFIFSMVLYLNSAAVAQPFADFVYENGRFYTVDETHPFASVIAVRNGKIVYSGDQFPVELNGPQTIHYNLHGRFALPGMNDSHLHFMGGGFSLLRIDLRYASGKQDFINQIAAYAGSIPKGEWILGGNWDHTLWEGRPLPDREWIDAVTPDNPVFINRLDGHMALANSLAIELAGIDNAITTPLGGAIVRRPDGELSGVFKESAQNLISRVIPEAGMEMKLIAARAAIKHLLERGITSVQDMGSWSDLTVYKKLLEQGELKVRIALYPPLPQWKKIKELKEQIPHSPFLKVIGFKGFMDGSLGSETARFFKPYLTNPENRGLWNEQTQPPEKMLNRIHAAVKAGYQVVIHAIGTEANAQLLETYVQISGKNTAGHRFRIEHAQHLRAQDIPLFGKYGIIASMQPYHIIDDGRWAAKKIDPERIKTTYAFRDLLDTGARLVFGSDWDVAPVSPLWGLYAAVTRRTLDGKHPDGWVPEQKIKLAEAIRAYTMDGAYAEFAENEKGSLSKGKWADFTVLSKNPFETDPVELKNLKVLKTVVAGEIVYESDESELTEGN